MYKRQIHSKVWRPKLYEANSKPFIFGNSGIVGHRPQEYLFVIKSVIALFQMLGKGLLMEFFDITKYFDKENLRDVLNNIYAAGVRGKNYRMWYKLNKNSKISVKIPGIGLSEEKNTGELIAQGTIGVALI